MYILLSLSIDIHAITVYNIYKLKSERDEPKGVNTMKAKDIKSRVCIIANALIKQGASRSAAMVRAWITVKLHRIDTKTAGVTHGNRQQLLARLSRYSPEEITIKLQREQDNAADKNAVQVIAAVKGKGAAVMGYLNRQLAAAIAPLMDKGKAVASSFLAVTGGADYYLTYGLNIRIAV